MINEMLRSELVAMRAEDLAVRAELAAANELGGPYVPRMEAVRENYRWWQEWKVSKGFSAATLDLD